MRFEALQVAILQLTQERDREERARLLVVETRKGLRVGDVAAASRVLGNVPDFHLPRLPVFVIHLGDAFLREHVPGGRLGKAAQPRSSEKNAASRAGQTPCARWAVTISLLEQKACVTAENRSFEEKQPLVFLPKSRFMVE